MRTCRLRRPARHHHRLRRPPCTPLTIDDHGADTITLHDTAAAARATLDIYLELADYNCRPAQLHSVHSALELFAPHEDDPRIVGVATIEPYTELDARRDLNTVLDAVTRPTALAC